jgi:hypothetical protein
MDGTRGNVEGDGDDASLEFDTDAKRSVAGLTLTALLLTVLFVVGLYAAARAGDANPACLKRKMNDEHTLMEAFFQNSPEENAVAQAVRACLPVAATMPFGRHNGAWGAQ